MAAYFSVGGEDIYQSLLRSNHISDESASMDVIPEIGTDFYLKPVKPIWFHSLDLSPDLAKILDLLQK